MKKWLWWIVGLGAVIVIGVLLWWLYWYRAEWAGFYTPQPSAYEGWKRLWDWLELLIVPLVLAIGGFLLNRAQRRSEQDIAYQQRKNEQRIARDREEERLLQNYFDIMKELLLEKDLRTSGEGSEVRSVARARTLAVLREVNKTRKGSVMWFLIEAELIGEVATANLKGRELEVNQRHNVIDLFAANLTGADLRWADLSGADLIKADLREAHLVAANLHRADLREADLRGAGLSTAGLHGADLDFANLSAAYLIGANLHEANLVGANLSEANLMGADLVGADLRGADLRGADLRGAKYNSEPYEKFGSTYQPTQWSPDFDPVAAGAIDVSKAGE